MSDLRKAAQAALSYWDSESWVDSVMTDKMDALRAALAQPKADCGEAGHDEGRCGNASCCRASALAKPEAEPVARVAEVHMSRYTIEWTNGPLPEGALLYAQQPTLAKPDQPTADGPTSDPGRSAPDLAASDHGLPVLPAATAVGTCIKNGMPAVAYAYTSDQMLAFRAEGVAQERERCARVSEQYADALEKLYQSGGGLDGDFNAIGCARALADAIRKG